MYEEMSDEQLAKRISETMDLKYESALRAVRSRDPSLGRDWAISILRSRARYKQRTARLGERIASMRRALY
jgi:hypothetical protein